MKATTERPVVIAAPLPLIEQIDSGHNYRWTICSLVFFATTINYLDRAVISLLKPILSQEFNWSEITYANIVVAFQLCYAIGLVASGKLIDKLGTKIGYAWATGLWSIAAIAHAAVTRTFGFFIVRGALGITEAGNFPSAIKTIAEWFPKKERAFATGIFNSGTNIGAIIAPLTVPFIALEWGWRWAFILTGLMGLIWLILWFLLYEVPTKHRKVSAAELAFINSDELKPVSGAEIQPVTGAHSEHVSGAEIQPVAGAHSKHVSGAEIQPVADEFPKFTWLQLLGFRQTWAFASGKFLTDPVWWFYLFWLPDFLAKQYGLKNTALALPIALAYTMATAGSVFGGWLPMYFIRQGMTVFRARKMTMLIYALTALPVIFTQYLGGFSMWLAVMTIGLAMAAHQAWSANMYTTVSDSFPKSETGSVTGIGSMFGALGGILIALFAGHLFDYYKAGHHIQTGYFIMFSGCSLAYLLAWIVVQILNPVKKIINSDV